MTSRVVLQLSGSAGPGRAALVWSVRLSVALLALVLSAILGSGCAPRAMPKAADGVLDLSAWSFEEDGLVALDGEWEFYWQRLLTPGDLAGRQGGPLRPSGFLAVPGGWAGWRLGDEPLPADGYATYRLRVDTSGFDGIMALHIPYLLSAYRLWVDETLVATSGIVGTTAETTAPQYVPTIAYFTPRTGSIQIVIQVANFDFRNGGVWSRLQLGSASQIVNRQARGVVLSMVLLGGILIMAVYHLVVYLLRRGERSALYFGLFCLVIAARIPLTGNQLLLQLVPTIPAGLHIRVEYLTGYAALPVFLLFLASLYPQEVARAALRLALVVAGGLALVTVLAPVRLSSTLIVPYEVILTLFVVYFVTVLVRAAVHGREGARVFLLGAGLFFAALIHDLLHYNRIVLSTDLLPLGLLVLILAQSAVLAERFAQAFHRQVVLGAENARLLADLRQHLDERRQWRRLLADREEQLKKDIAELLHSRVQTRLLVIWHWLGELPRLWEREPREARVLLGRARDELDRLRETDIRQASHLLHPTVIGVGLVPAVRSLAASYEARAHPLLEVDPRLEALEHASPGQLPEPVRLAAYRIVEEALTNVYAHAAATRVQVFLGLTADGQLSLQVQDDGRGLPSSRLQPGLGLRSIAARVGELGGRWELTGVPGRGTTLVAWLPLEELPPAPAASATLSSDLGVLSGG